MLGPEVLMILSPLDILFVIYSLLNVLQDLQHGEMVTYSTVRASPAYADPSNLYAAIDKPKKK